MDRPVASGETAARRLRLGRCELDLDAGELIGPDGELAALRRQSLEVLLLLGRHAGHVVGKDELMQRVWPDVVVGEGSLAQAVADIRRVLGDAEHRLVRNVARRGYLLAPQPAAAPLPAPASAPAPEAAAPRARRLAIAAALALLAIAAAWLAFAPGGSAAWRSPGALAPLPADAPEFSIAVLPVAVEGDGQGIDWLAESLHGDLITELARTTPGGIVIARDTMAAWRGRPADPRLVARELGVRHVVRASLRRDGPRTREGEALRLNLVLIDGETGVQRWADTLSTTHAALAQAVGDFAVRIERSLLPEVYRVGAARRAGLSPTAVDADELAMRAYALWYRAFSRENVLEALALCEQAVARDPDSVRGWHGVGFLTLHAWLNGWGGTRDAALARIEQAAQALRRIDPEGSFTYNTGTIPLFLRGDVAAMLRHTSAWVERHDVPTAHGAQGAALLFNGRFDDAVRALERALRLSPRDTFRAEWQYRLAMAHFAAGRDALARDWSLAAEQSNPRLRWPPVHVAALLRLGQAAEARRQLAAYEARHGRFDAAQVGPRMPGQEPRFAAARGELLAALAAAAATSRSSPRSRSRSATGARGWASPRRPSASARCGAARRGLNPPTSHRPLCRSVAVAVPRPALGSVMAIAGTRARAPLRSWNRRPDGRAPLASPMALRGVFRRPTGARASASAPSICSAHEPDEL